MVRSELVKMLAAKYPNILYKDTEKITNLIFLEIIDALCRGENIEIRGFGTYKIINRKARIGRNPKNYDIVQVPAKKAIRWKMSKVLFNQLNKNFTEKKISGSYQSELYFVNNIILALDTSNLEDAIDIAKKVKDKIFTIKIGLELFNAHGKNGVKKFNEIGITNLMLDLKLKDIGQTVYKAIKALDDIKFGYLTVHGQGGREMIERAVRAADEIQSKPKIMVVTILTSLSDKDLKDVGNNNTVNEQVKKMSALAKDLNVGIVCSGKEAKIVREILGPDLPIFTPGVRMNNDNNNDQKRVCTPSESIRSGANKVIMGRSLIAGNLEENISKVSNSIKI